MGNLGTRRRGFLRTHTATAPSTTTTTDFVLMELPTQDCPGAAERDPATSPVTSERRRLIIPRIRPRRQRRTQGVRRPLQPRERRRWPRLQQPKLWEPRVQPRKQRPPRQRVRRESIWRSAERKGVQPRLWPGPQLQQSGHPRQPRKQQRTRRTDEWSPGT